MNSFCQLLKKDGVKRGYVVFDEGELKSSGGLFDEISKFYENESKDFAKHEVKKKGHLTQQNFLKRVHSLNTMKRQILYLVFLFKIQKEVQDMEVLDYGIITMCQILLQMVFAFHKVWEEKVHLQVFIGVVVKELFVKTIILII